MNGGDAAILFACKRLLHRAFPSLESIIVFSSSAAVAQRYYPELDLYRQPLEIHRHRSSPRLSDRALYTIARIRREAGIKQILAGRLWLGRLLVDAQTRRFLDVLPTLDFLCTAGGTYITEHYEWRHRIILLEIAKAHGIPVVFLTQSMWVETGEERLELLRRTLPKFDVFLVRDAPSASFLIGLGVAAERIHQVSDAAFVFAHPDAWQGEQEPASEMRVAVSVRHWEHSPRGRTTELYLNSVAAAVEWLVTKRNAQITFLSTCQGVPEYPFDDSRTAEDIVAILPASVRRSTRIENGFHDPHRLIELYSTFDFVIATRMHAAILALSAGVPVLPIAYEFKTTELWRSFGLSDYIANIDEIEPKAFVSLAQRFVTDLPMIRKTLRSGVRSAHESALSAAEVIRSALKDDHSSNHPFGLSRAAQSALAENPDAQPETGLQPFGIRRNRCNHLES